MENTLHSTRWHVHSQLISELIERLGSYSLVTKITSAKLPVPIFCGCQSRDTKRRRTMRTNAPSLSCLQMQIIGILYGRTVCLSMKSDQVPFVSGNKCLFIMFFLFMVLKYAVHKSYEKSVPNRHDICSRIRQVSSINFTSHQKRVKYAQHYALTIKMLWSQHKSSTEDLSLRANIALKSDRCEIYVIFWSTAYSSFYSWWIKPKLCLNVSL